MLLILSTVAAGFVVVGFLGDVFFFLGDVVLVFFLAWLLAFILSPVVARLTRVVPLLSRVGAVIVVYALLLGGLILLALTCSPSDRAAQQPAGGVAPEAAAGAWLDETGGRGRRCAHQLYLIRGVRNAYAMSTPRFTMRKISAMMKMMACTVG